MLVVSLKNAIDEIESVIANGNEIFFSELTPEQMSLLVQIIENYQGSFHVPELSGNIIINKIDLQQEVVCKSSIALPYGSLVTSEKLLVDNLINTFL